MEVDWRDGPPRQQFMWVFWFHGQLGSAGTVDDDAAPSTCIEPRIPRNLDIALGQRNATQHSQLERTI